MNLKIIPCSLGLTCLETVQLEIKLKTISLLFNCALARLALAPLYFYFYGEEINNRFVSAKHTKVPSCT